MSVSLEASIRTCKVDTSYANRVESDRFLNPGNMVCPTWTGVDTAGRRVSPDSFVTKTAGCNSAEDRVVVENNQRPQYMEYINLSANGIEGSIYGDNGGSPEMYGNTMPYAETGAYNDRFNYPSNYESCVAGSMNGATCTNNVHNITGQFGGVSQFEGQIYPSCGYFPYSQALSQQQQALRKQGAVENYYKSNNYRHASGF